jgi:hypothetical protein
MHFKDIASGDSAQEVLQLFRSFLVVERVHQVVFDE